MKTVLIAAFVLMVTGAGAFAKERHVRFAPRDAAGLRYEWLPVTLTEEERALLETRSDPPKTALDYFLLLPGEYFRNIEHSLERRVAFINRGTPGRCRCAK